MNSLSLSSAMEFHKAVSLFLVLFSCLVCSSQACQFFVGGKQGWVESFAESYNLWAKRNSFKVNDTLHFKYKKGEDSVLLVKKDDYFNCNTKQPLKKMEDGESEFMLDRSGPFYFVSGVADHCQKGQKLIVVVLHLKTPPFATPPTYAPPQLPPSTSVAPPQSPQVSPMAFNRRHLSFLLLPSSLPTSTSTSTTVSGVSPSSDSQYAEEELLCKQTYGFMPCSRTALGNLFLIIVYGYLIFVACKCVFDGSEMLKVLGPGCCFGKIAVPKLVALPSAIFILVSGLSGTKESAQSQVSVGMGLLAGSTVMLLTVIWGSCIIVGKWDIEPSVATDGQNTKGFSLTETGVSTDIWTCYTARIMAISVIPFIVVQIPQILHSTSGRNLAVLTALVVSVLMFIAYCLYQVFQPWIQRRRFAYARHRYATSRIMNLRQNALGRLFKDRGEPNEEVTKILFDLIDEKKDEQLSFSELEALIIRIMFNEKNLDEDDAAYKLLPDVETDQENQTDSGEFIEGTEIRLSGVLPGNRSGDPASEAAKLVSDFHKKTNWEPDLLGEEEETCEVENPKSIYFKAVPMLFIGTIIAAAFAYPLVIAITNFSNATNIPPFFVSFIALPMATKLSVVVPLLIYASHKRIRTASLTFTELYATVSTNNVIYLSVFLAIVYIRGLRWDFSSEVLAIAVVCILVGGFASFRTTFPLWTCLPAYMLYPFSLALVYVLDCLLGWT